LICAPQDARCHYEVLIRYIPGRLITVSCKLTAFAQGALAPTGKHSQKHNGKIETTYDKAKNETVVQLRPMFIRRVTAIYETPFQNPPVGGYEVSGVEDGLSITAFFSYLGKIPARPKVMVLGFTSNEWRDV